MNAIADDGIALFSLAQGSKIGMAPFKRNLKTFRAATQNV